MHVPRSPSPVLGKGVRRTGEGQMGSTILRSRCGTLDKRLRFPFFIVGDSICHHNCGRPARITPVGCDWTNSHLSGVVPRSWWRVLVHRRRSCDLPPCRTGQFRCFERSRETLRVGGRRPRLPQFRGHTETCAAHYVVCHRAASGQTLFANRLVLYISIEITGCLSMQVGFVSVFFVFLFRSPSA